MLLRTDYSGDILDASLLHFFPTCYLQPQQIWLLSKLFEGSASTLSENWRLLAPFVREKASFLAVLVKFTIIHTLVPPLPVLPELERCGLDLLVCNRQGFTPQSYLTS